MQGIIHPWAMAMDADDRHRLMGLAGYCVGEYGSRSPVGRAIRQALFCRAVRANEEDMDTAEWLAWCDRIVGAMPVTPYRALLALYSVAAILERSMPRDSEASGWETVGTQRECWATLRRSIDEHQSTLPAGCVVTELTESGVGADDDDDDDNDVGSILSAIVVMVRSGMAGGRPHGRPDATAADDTPAADAN